MKVIFTLLMIALGVALAYGVWALLIYGVCWAFELHYDWKYPVGAMLLTLIITRFFK